jgi:hypothetical protein
VGSKELLYKKVQLIAYKSGWVTYRIAAKTLKSYSAGIIRLDTLCWRRRRTFAGGL